MSKKNSLTKEEIEHECELLHREAEMDVEQLRKLYSGQIDHEPEQNDKSEVTLEHYKIMRQELRESEVTNFRGLFSRFI